jgi:hypothetical protein
MIISCPGSEEHRLKPVPQEGRNVSKQPTNLLLRWVQRARGGLCGGNRETKVDIRRVQKFKGLKVQRFRSTTIS